jgi:hypothetical protein
MVIRSGETAAGEAKGAKRGKHVPHIKAGLDFQARHDKEFISQKQKPDGV